MAMARSSTFASSPPRICFLLSSTTDLDYWLPNTRRPFLTVIPQSGAKKSFKLCESMATLPDIPLQELPDSSLLHMDFLESTWFKTHGQSHQLPTPERVRAIGESQRNATVVRFEELGLVVKSGSHIHVTEAINLWAVRKFCGDKFPVPELYAWRVIELDDQCHEVFIYMQLMPGLTLEERWATLSDTEKQSISNELRAVVSSFRTLRVDGAEQFIGTINNGPSLDKGLKFQPKLRPFPNRQAFHDWLSWIWRRHVADPSSVEDPWRDLLLDDGPLAFTHGDLRPVNIIVTATSPVQLVGVIDWEQAGWYPDYWEYCKARYTTDYQGEWRSWMERFLEPDASSLEAYDFYMNSIGYY